MTVSSTVNTSPIYAGNDTTGPWAFSFKTFDQAELEVIKASSAGVETILTLTTEYTVSLNGDQNASPGGEVTTVANVATGESLRVRWVGIPTQETDIQNAGGFYPEVIENALDKLTMLTQRNTEEIGRAVKTTITSGDDPDALVASLLAAEANAAASEAAAAVSESNAAASAAAAQATVDASIWNDVVFKVFADSPVTLTDADSGKLFAVDCTSGNVVINLPAIADLTLSLPWSVGFRKTDSSANTVTLNRASTDTIDGATSATLTVQGEGRVIVPDTDPSPDTWTSMAFGGSPTITDGSVTTIKLNDAVFSGLSAVSPATDDEIPLADTSASGVKKKATIADILALAGSSGAPSGSVFDYVGSTAPSGYVLLSGRTIGNAASGGTERANADTVTLFTLLWDSMANAEAPVSGGRGANAAADYAANKTITLPDGRGRTIAGKDNMGGTTASRITSGGSGILGTTLGIAGGAETVSLSSAQNAAHTHTTTCVNIGGSTYGLGPPGKGATSAQSTAVTSSSSGSGTAHQNTQPTLVLNKIIKL